jgi:hypothetical protein
MGGTVRLRNSTHRREKVTRTRLAGIAIASLTAPATRPHGVVTKNNQTADMPPCHLDTTAPIRDRPLACAPNCGDADTLSQYRYHTPVWSSHMKGTG